MEILNGTVWTHTPPPSEEGQLMHGRKNSCKNLMMGHLLIGRTCGETNLYQLLDSARSIAYIYCGKICTMLVGYLLC